MVFVRAISCNPAASAENISALSGVLSFTKKARPRPRMTWHSLIHPPPDLARDSIVKGAPDARRIERSMSRQGSMQKPEWSRRWTPMQR
jgi:hypothetical protein